MKKERRSYWTSFILHWENRYCIIRNLINVSQDY